MSAAFLVQKKPFDCRAGHNHQPDGEFKRTRTIGEISGISFRLANDTKNEIPKKV